MLLHPCFSFLARVPRFVLPLLLLGLMASGQAFAADEKKAERRVAVGKCTSETASLLRREAPDKPWQVVKQNEELFSGDLLLGGAGATVESKNGAVQLTFAGDMDGTSPFPILETAVVLHENADADLDFTFDRGRVDLTNRKQKGPARVQVRIRDKSGEVVLTEPGARVALEIYGRWLKGVPFTKDPKPGEGPALAICVLALKGEIEIKGKAGHLTLKVPPGPALLMTIDLNDPDFTPQQLKELPAWVVDEGKSERAKKIKAILAKFRKTAVDKSIPDALDQLLKSEDEFERRFAIIMTGALDDLGRMATALTTTKHTDVWDAAILALRHWIGRGPGQDQKLYKGLVEQGKLPAAEAEIVLNLLHSFGDEDLARPETYEALIDYLESDRVGLRALANWHLYRLVPDGRKIGYDPLASKEKRDQAVKEWRKLVPSGKLPPKPKVDDK